MSTDTYWYLASPYTDHPRGVNEAYRVAGRNTAVLLDAGVPVFSPIVHSHTTNIHMRHTEDDHAFWMDVDRTMMRAAHGLIYLEEPGSLVSKGMHEELIEFVKAGKPVIFMTPGEVPEELRQGRLI